MDIHEVGYKLKNFLDKYSSILLEEHLHEMKFHLEFLKLFKDSSQVLTTLGEFHWTICPYTNEEIETVPDTCCCSSAEKTMARVVKLINLYKRLNL